MKNTDTPQKTENSIVAEISELEQAAGAKRAELEAFNQKESLRRHPLNVLLQERKNLNEKIAWAKSTIAAHKTDSDEFEKMCDSFFNTPHGNQPRAYSFAVPTLGYPFAAASRAVEFLNVRLEKAEKELMQLESKIVTQASSLGLEEMIPADLKK
jgi:hypothetical protein